MIRQTVHDHWTVHPVGDLTAVPQTIRQADIKATIPGCIHTDLLAAGLIPDPYLHQHEAELRWIGKSNWEYRTAFEIEAAITDESHLDLVCEGLDTLATLTLNGHRLGSTQDMHIPHRFPVKLLARPGMNELIIRFDSAVKYVLAMQEKRGTWPFAGHGTNPPLPHNQLRKMSCSFGWDWGPALVTCGIWKSIHLEAWSVARITGVRPLVTTACPHGATVQVHVQLEHARHTQPVTVEALLAHGDQTRIACRQMIPAGQTDTVLELNVAKPELWWPRGYGDQPLYHLNLMVIDEARNELDHWFGRLGLRTVELDTRSDDIGSRMVLKINGKEVFARGADWIPDDCFLHRAHDPARLETRLKQACDLNMNILRVWGGGVYECDTFYDLCDELGLLVWQDFLFACAAYPEDALRDLVEQEARHHIVRLSRHPSLVIWNGCNENVWGYRSWSFNGQTWIDHIGDRPWGANFYFELLPNILNELDPTRPYWPASPWSGDTNYKEGRFPNIPTHGNMHVWSVWFGGNFDQFRQVTPRFCSEFGFQGPPTYATLVRAISSDQMRFDSPVMRDHQKCREGLEKIHHFAEQWFDVPDNFDDQLFLYQLNQARALETGVTWFRSRVPVCMGLIYWQLNDCWPVISWSAVDGDGRYKPLAYATRRFFAPRLLTIQPLSADDDTLQLFAHNDDCRPWHGTVHVRRMDFAGNTLAEARVNLDLPAHANRLLLPLPTDLAQPADRTNEFIVAQLVEEERRMPRAFWYFEPDKHLRYPDPHFRAELTITGEAHRLTLTAQSFLRDLAIFPDRLHPQAIVSDQLLTLLPDESVTLVIQSPVLLTLEALTQLPVLQCVNRFGCRSIQRSGHDAS